MIYVLILTEGMVLNLNYVVHPWLDIHMITVAIIHSVLLFCSQKLAKQALVNLYTTVTYMQTHAHIYVYI